MTIFILGNQPSAGKLKQINNITFFEEGGGIVLPKHFMFNRFYHIEWQNWRYQLSGLFGACLKVPGDVAREQEEEFSNSLLCHTNSN